MKKMFLLGNPRSGTSLLRLMLNAHPDIIAPPESGFLHWWYEKYKDWSLEDGQSSAAIAGYVTDLLSSKKIETWCLNRNDLIDFLRRKKPADYESLSALVYEYYACMVNKTPSVIIDKNNYYIHHLSDLKLIWPNAFYIYLIRDGRDVACSYLNIKKLKTNSPYKPSLPSSIEKIAAEWDTNNRRIYDFLSQYNSKKWIMVKFEELILNPISTLQTITHMIDIKYSQQMMEYTKHNDEPQATLDWKKKTLSMPDVSNINKYKKQLSKNQINIFNRIARETLIYRGYTL